MARIPIPQYRQQQQTPLSGPTARAPMVAVEDTTGQAIQGIGHGLERAAQAQGRLEQEDARAWVSKASSEDQVKWLTRLNDLQNSAEPGAPDFTPNVLKEYDDYMGKALENAPATAKPFYREQLQQGRVYLAQRAVTWQSQQHRSNTVSQYDQGAQADAIAIGMDPSLYPERLAARQAAIATSELPPDVKTKLAGDSRALLSVAAETTQMKANPSAWLEARRPGIPGIVSAAADLNGIDPGYMMAVAHIETGGTFDPKAKNPKSTAGGLFQFTDPTWEQYAPGQDKNDPASNAKAAASFSADNQKTLTRALGRQPQGWEMYLAHQQGAGGAAALLRADPDATVASALKDAGIANADRAAADNGMAGMPVKNALSMWQSKFDQSYAKYSGTPSAPDQPGRMGVPSFDNLDWQTQQKMQHEAVTLFKQRQAEHRAILTDSVRDQESSWLSGQDYKGPLATKDQFVQAYGVADGLDRWGKHQDIYQTGQDIQTLAGMSNNDIAGALESRKPVGGPGFESDARRFDILQKAASAVIEQRKKDPAAFVLNSNDGVRASYEAMVSAPPESIVAATRDYASKALAEQQRLGIADPHLLSANQAQSAVQMFFDQKEGGNNAAQLVSQMESQWGEHWPTVYKQLSKSGKLPPVALVIPNMPDAGARERAARRALVDPDVYKKRLASTDPRDIETRLTQEMEPLWNSFSNQNGGVNTYQAIYNEAKKASLEYAANGKSIGDAVTQAYDEFVGQSYEFGSTFRVPIKEKPDSVIGGTRSIIKNLDSLDLKMPDSTRGLRPDEVKSAYLDAVKSNYQFVTNGDETGLDLYVMGNNGLNPVLNKQDRKVSFTWEQLRQSVKPLDIAREQANSIPPWTPEAYR